MALRLLTAICFDRKRQTDSCEIDAHFALRQRWMDDSTLTSLLEYGWWAAMTIIACTRRASVVRQLCASFPLLLTALSRVTASTINQRRRGAFYRCNRACSTERNQARGAGRRHHRPTLRCASHLNGYCHTVQCTRVALSQSSVAWIC